MFVLGKRGFWVQSFGKTGGCDAEGIWGVGGVMRQKTTKADIGYTLYLRPRKGVMMTTKVKRIIATMYLLP